MQFCEIFRFFKTSDIKIFQKLYVCIIMYIYIVNMYAYKCIKYMFIKVCNVYKYMYMY